MLLLALLSFLAALTVWSGFIYLTMFSGVLAVLGAMQDVWYGLTTNRDDPWF